MIAFVAGMLIQSAALGMLAEIALHPTFPESEVERLRDERLNDLLQAQAGRDLLASQGDQIAQVVRGEMAEGRIQILTHRTEPTVWQPRWLDHPNGALALTSVAIVVADPWEAARRFARFTGRPATPATFGQTIELDYVFP